VTTAPSDESSWARPCLFPPPLQLQRLTSPGDSQLQADIAFALPAARVAAIACNRMRVSCRLVIVQQDGAEVCLADACSRVELMFATKNDQYESFEDFDSVTVSPQLTGGAFAVDCPALRCCAHVRMRVRIGAASAAAAGGDWFAIVRDVQFSPDVRAAAPLQKREGSVAVDDVLVLLLGRLDGPESLLLSSVVLTRRTNEPAWNTHRSVWNGLIDRFPAIIVVARSEDDVCRTVALARELSLELTVKGGGHNVAGSAVADGALMIDLSLFNSISLRLDQSPPRIAVGGGCTWSAVDAALHPHGLAVPAGNAASVALLFNVSVLTLHLQVSSATLELVDSRWAAASATAAATLAS
jgi:hypothetical protein